MQVNMLVYLRFYYIRGVTMNLQLMQRFAAAIVLTAGLGLNQVATAQTSDRTPSSSIIPTVEDAPHGEIETIENIPPLFLPVTPSPSRRTLPLDVTAPDEPYILYPNTVFERLIGENNLKLRLNVQPDRDGANLGVGLPIE